MGYGLDTKDMERHSVDLRLYLDKAKRRFCLAQMPDNFARIVSSFLPGPEEQGNVIEMERLSTLDDSQKLTQFLDYLVDRCTKPEQHDLLQDSLRKIIQQSRRRSILDNQTGEPSEPMCYFCAADLNTDNRPPTRHLNAHVTEPVPTSLNTEQAPAVNVRNPSPELDRVRYEFCLQPEQNEPSGAQADPEPQQQPQQQCGEVQQHHQEDPQATLMQIKQAPFGKLDQIEQEQQGRSTVPEREASILLTPSSLAKKQSKGIRPQRRKHKSKRSKTLSQQVTPPIQRPPQAHTQQPFQHQPQISHHYQSQYHQQPPPRRQQSTAPSFYDQEDGEVRSVAYQPQAPARSHPLEEIPCLAPDRNYLPGRRYVSSSAQSNNNMEMFLPTTPPNTPGPSANGNEFRVSVPQQKRMKAF